MAVCIAIIGKENSPKYIVCSDPSRELDFHYKVHTSLDIIQEKLALSGPKPTNELYIGHLYSTEEHKIHGYVTNTGVKIVIVYDDIPSSPRDSEIKNMFKDIHNAYTDVVCNPFYLPGENIKSKKFDLKIKEKLAKIC